MLAFGLVSLFGDLVYEGARGIIPSYLKLLGMSSAALGVALGIAEFIAYASRIFTGYLADRSNRHRLMIFLGYGAIAFLPLLAFVYDRRVAILLIFLERFGKALRAPARDAIIGEVSTGMRGKAFGIHEAMDQIGASLGPILVATLVMLYGIREALLFLFIPFLFIVAALVYARSLHPEPGISKGPLGFLVRPMHVAVFFNAASMMLPFLLLYEVTGVVKLYEVPLIYFYINAVDAITSIIAGKLYDDLGMVIPFIGFVLSPIPALIYYYMFSLYFPRYVRASTFIGIVMGLRESVYRAMIADTAKASLASEFGAYYTFLGLGMALGGSAYGYLMIYKHRLPIYAIVTALLGIALFLTEVKIGGSQ